MTTLCNVIAAGLTLLALTPTWPQQGEGTPAAVQGDAAEASRPDAAEPPTATGADAIESGDAAIAPDESPAGEAIDGTDTPGPGAPITPADLPTAEQLKEALAAQYRLHMEAQRYKDAVAVAQSALELASLDVDPNDPALVEPLLQLAGAQLAAEDYHAAVTTYLRSIELVERSEGPFSERLIEPLAGLGEAYQKAGLHEQAISAFQTAIHVTRRNEGLFNLQQQDLLEDASDSHYHLGEFEEADREQRYALRTAQETYGEADPRTVPALERLARFYRRTDQYSVERTYLKRAIRIIEQAEGPDALRLVDLLRTLAASYREERMRHSEAERSLERALRIVESQQQIDFTEQVETLLAIGDYHVVNRDSRQAGEYYRRAWDLLQARGDQQVLQDTFGQPQRLYYSPPYADPSDVVVDDEGEARFVEFRFTVTEEGRVSSLEVIESTLPNSITRELITSLKAARYRPRYVDGEPVSTEGVLLKQSYPKRALRRLPERDRMMARPGGTY